MKLYEEFANDDVKVEWNAMLKIGEIFHDKIVKNPILDDYYLAGKSVYPEDKREWDMSDNNLNLKHLDFEFHYYFTSFVMNDFYVSDFDKKIKEFKEIVNELKKIFNGLEIRIFDSNSGYSADTNVTVHVKYENLVKNPEVKNLIVSAVGINKFKL
jgi:hypothetical protein